MPRIACKDCAVTTHLEKEHTVFAWILTPKGESRNAVGATNGMFRATTGLVTRTIGD